MISREKRTFFSITGIICFVIFAHYLNWLKPVENFFRSFINPLSAKLYDISNIKDQKLAQFKTIDELQSAYLKLDEEYLKTKIDVVNLQLLTQENIELKKQLNFLDEKKVSVLGARVIGKNIDPLGNTIIIDRGRLDGVDLQYAVSAGTGVLVGKIVRVENHSAVVQLINDNHSKIAGMLANGNASIGLVEGGYGISIRMNYVPQNENINIGDSVISSGLEQNIPRGLLIGSVEAIEKEAYQPFQSAILKPTVNLEKISLVSVLVPQKE